VRGIKRGILEDTPEDGVLAEEDRQTWPGRHLTQIHRRFCPREVTELTESKKPYTQKMNRLRYLSKNGDDGCAALRTEMDRMVAQAWADYDKIDELAEARHAKAMADAAGGVDEAEQHRTEATKALIR